MFDPKKCHPLPPSWDTQVKAESIRTICMVFRGKPPPPYKCKPSSGPVIPPLQQKPWKRPQTWSLKSLKMAFSCKILAHTVETQKPNMFPSVGPLCPRNIHQSCAESTCHSRLCLCLVSCTSSAGSHTICSLRLAKHGQSYLMQGIETFPWVWNWLSHKLHTTRQNNRRMP